MKEYKPIRIVKDIQVSVRSRADAARRYPHGEVRNVPVRDWKRLPGFTVMYRHPQRINVPSDSEMGLVAAGFAKLIPQHKELGCDDPSSELSGSRQKTARHKRKAMKEINAPEPEPAPMPEPLPEPEPKPEKK